MRTTLIFLFVGQACLLNADPLPKAEEPRNAFSWLRHEVVERDTSEDSLWLRQWLVNEPDAATAWIRKTLNNTQNALRICKTWFANNSEILDSLIGETAIESWYVDQALDENQDAATWESLKAGRNDTEFAIKELRETLTNESALFVEAINEWPAEEDNDGAPKFLLLLMAAIASGDEDDSTSDDDEGESLWKKLSQADSNEPRNALTWVKRVVLSGTGDETAWLRDALVKDPEGATGWIKQALRNTKECMAAIKLALKNETQAINVVESETRSGLWYVDQALDEHQDAETWDKLKSERNDTETAARWIRGNLANSTQEVLSWLKEVLSNENEEARFVLSFLFVSPETDDNSSLSLSVEEDDEDFWSKLLEAKTSKNTVA
ncbi:uncharacterized protein LOC105690028 [Athalia rosae]|uniref:uncharacterized protein LOC105690028 n=1 Tax=Athalia rosae TaxID=37344 RepID=UPI00203491F2|nr:uncharacterized protein LOC105690028 [Athalia rosae]